ncbi:hypothetical protein GE061_008263 [Apolygus lucorum]|uniref:PDZ domain-containing protein n=1 Tax=Apolygus lucorum TaxID=248454 RepID=A0A8S9WSY4_APOLU|nr:hypothetical protein GE061_008263 [Apolygus lucorum]
MKSHCEIGKMFHSFKVLRRKSPDKRNTQNRKSTSKWSLDRALCHGSTERVATESIAVNEPESPQLSPSHGLQTPQCNHDELWQECNSYGSDIVSTRIVGVPLERDPVQGLGINLRPSRSGGSLVVTHVKPYGPADREGTIKVGDRILAVDGQRLAGMSPKESCDALLRCGTDRPAWLTVEYDVSVMTQLRAVGRLLIEIECGPEDELRNEIGLSLIDSPIGEVIVSRVRVASIAERCGAFLPGDQILAVNEYRVENSSLRARDVARILDNTKSSLMQVEILPLVTTNEPVVPYNRSPSPAYSQPYQESGRKSRSHSNIKQSYHDFNENINSLNFQKYQTFEDDLTPNPELRIESGLVTLQIGAGQEYGIVFRSAPSKKGVVICYLEPHSVAGTCGVLQVGDRILSANGRQLSERVSRLEELGNTVHLSVQFDVEIWPRTCCEKGTPKRVKLTRSKNSGFGVTISDTGDEGIIVSDVRWGSVAHRCGRIRNHDKVVGIDQTRVTDMPTAMEIFRSCGSTVTFHLISGSDIGYSSPGLPSVDSAIDSWESGIDRNMQTYNGFDQELLDWRMEPTRESTDNSFTATSPTQQSDDDDTCSSLRLSESLLDGQRPSHIPPPPPSPPCPLQTNYRLRKVNLPVHWRGSSTNTAALDPVEQAQIAPCPPAEPQVSSFSTFRGPKTPPAHQRDTSVTTSIFQVTLFKSVAFDDFGFSVSDGLYEKGVFINTIKPGSPADLCNSIRPYDKIIQVNDVPTHDLDCCMTVPLMASAGKKLTLTVLRQNNRNHSKTTGPFRGEDNGAGSCRQLSSYTTETL